MPHSVSVSARTYRRVRAFADAHGMSMHDVMVAMLRWMERTVTR
jgi:hypothetical protein